MRKQLQDEINKENSKQTQAEALKEEFERLKQINLEYYAQAAAFQSTFEKLERLKSQKEMLEKNRRHIRDGMSEMSGRL
jgi:DNA repair protein RAD50